MEKRSLYIPYNNLTSFTRFLIQTRDAIPVDEQAHQSAINSTIIVNGCIILEGMFYTLIKTQLHLAEYEFSKDKTKIVKRENPALMNKMLLEMNKQLDGDTWMKYIDRFEFFFNLKIDRSNNLWKAIEKMFQFRNFIVHGNEYEFVITNSKVHAINKKLQAIYRFCSEKKLVSVDLENRRINLLTNQSANYFFLKTCEFALYIDSLIPNGNGAKSSLDLFHFQDHIDNY